MTTKLRAIADGADVIVNGYTFRREEEKVYVLNLNKPDRAALMTLSGEVLETSMDDIELEIVREYLQRNRKYRQRALTEPLSAPDLTLVLFYMHNPKPYLVDLFVTSASQLITPMNQPSKWRNPQHIVLLALVPTIYCALAELHPMFSKNKFEAICMLFIASKDAEWCFYLVVHHSILNGVWHSAAIKYIRIESGLYDYGVAGDLHQRALYAYSLSDSEDFLGP